LRRALSATVILTAVTLTTLIAPNAANSASPRLTPDEARVWVILVNDSDREIRVQAFTRQGMAREERFTLAPGQSYPIWGSSNGKHDLVANASWCEGSTQFDPNCDSKRYAYMKLNNPFIGWPWMQVKSGVTAEADWLRYSVGDKHTFLPHGKTGKVKIATERLDDKASGTNRFRVEFRTIPQ
jgi:hypothetical protein